MEPCLEDLILVKLHCVKENVLKKRFEHEQNLGYQCCCYCWCILNYTMIHIVQLFFFFFQEHLFKILSGIARPISETT